MAFVGRTCNSDDLRAQDLANLTCDGTSRACCAGDYESLTRFQLSDIGDSLLKMGEALEEVEIRINIRNMPSDLIERIS